MSKSLCVIKKFRVTSSTYKRGRGEGEREGEEQGEEDGGREGEREKEGERGEEREIDYFIRCRHLGCLLENLAYKREVILELWSNGQSHVTYCRQDWWLYRAMYFTILEHLKGGGREKFHWESMSEVVLEVLNNYMYIRMSYFCMHEHMQYEKCSSTMCTYAFIILQD